jgi:hypothetical protein
MHKVINEYAGEIDKRSTPVTTLKVPAIRIPRFFDRLCLRPGPLPCGLRPPGDANGDGSTDISDAVMVLAVLFTGSASPFPCGDGTSTDPGNLALVDWQPDGAIDISDAVAMLSHLFIGGPGHAMGRDCIPIAGCSDAEPRCR